ncbi:MAG: small conductance mechanosensitive channel [Colwellia sp.]
MVQASMERSKVDPTLIPFMGSLVSWLLKVLLFIFIASMVGVATSSFIAVLGAAGLAIGLTLQGSLANFAGGVLIMIFKLYKVVDLTVGVSYDADIEQTKAVLMDVHVNHDKVMQEPALFVSLAEMADSSVNFVVRPHCLPEHYWDVYFEVNEVVKKAPDKNAITFPFPQRDVHLIQS